MQKSVLSCLVAALVSVSALFGYEAPERDVQSAAAGSKAVPQELVKQPVFLFCPHKQGAASWSLYVIVDKNDPRTLLALGLEELTGKNSKDNTYRGVLDAQKDPSTQRNELGRLDVKDFATGRLEVKENELLSIKAEKVEAALKLTIDARVSLDGHFVVGGPEENRRSMILQYSSIYKFWQAKSLKLENTNGQNAVGKYAKTFTGIVFTAGTTMVSRICAVDEFGSPVVLLDR